LTVSRLYSFELLSRVALDEHFLAKNQLVVADNLLITQSVEKYLGRKSSSYLKQTRIGDNTG